MIRVKICGITRLEDALAAADSGADAIGFVFAKSSRKIAVEKARSISGAVGPWIATVGVFVNEKPSEILRIAARCQLSAVQLHGDETPSQVKTLKAAPFKVIKAFRVDEKFDLGRMMDFPADAFLLDAYVAGQYGGTGKVFNWGLLKKQKITKPWIVSGGLRPDNVAELLKICEPYGVDVSGGVEKSAGIKDKFLIRKFLENVKTR
jgi:phosphoribosylanthranilate isomerase